MRHGRKTGKHSCRPHIYGEQQPIRMWLSWKMNSF